MCEKSSGTVLLLLPPPIGMTGVFLGANRPPGDAIGLRAKTGWFGAGGVASTELRGAGLGGVDEEMTLDRGDETVRIEVGRDLGGEVPSSELGSGDSVKGFSVD